MDLNSIHNPYPAKKMKCLFLYYIQLLMIGWAGRWTQTPSTTYLQPKNEMLIFGLHSTSDDWSCWLMDSNPVHHPSPAKKMKCSFLVLMTRWPGQWTQTPSSAKKNEMLIFGLCSTPDDQPAWSMDLNPIGHPSPAKKMKCSFLDYIQLLMIGQAGRWTQNPSTTPLQPENEMLIFGLRSTSDDQPGWLIDSNAICHTSPAKKLKCSFLD